jgi:glycosyltransferase involved in cell wall biosynthesis
MKPPLSYFSPMPPFKSGIADYSEDLVNELSNYFTITVYIDNDYEPNKNKNITIKKYKEYENKKEPIIYNIGNHKCHNYMIKIMERYPGITILHDKTLFGLFEYSNSKNNIIKMLYNVYKEEGIVASKNYLKFITTRPEIRTVIERKPLTRYTGLYAKEKDVNGIHFRWSHKNIALNILEKGITDVHIKLYTEFPTKIQIKDNRGTKNITLKVNQVQTIKFSNNGRLKIRVSKPLGIISRVRDQGFRNMGIKIYEVKYKVKNEMKVFSLLKDKDKVETNIIENKKFTKLKEILQYEYNFNKRILENSKSIITHSNFLKGSLPKKTKSIKINHGAHLSKPIENRNKMRERLGYQKDDFIVSSYGNIQRHKGIKENLIAFKKFSEKYKKAIYICIGAEDQSINIREIIKNLNLEGKVIITGYKGIEKVIEYIYVSDVLLNSRFPSTGATSGSLIKALSIGTPCIISDLPENKEFPNNCVYRISNNKDKVNNIIEALIEIKEDKNLQKEMSKNAIKHIKEHHLWVHIVEEINSYIRENENTYN